MRVFVNAASVREGGPRVVVLKLLAALGAENPNLRIAMAAPPSLCAETPAAVTAHPVVIGRSPLAIARWYEFGLAAAAARWSADVVFSVTNYLPIRRLSVPSLLLEQHAGHFSPVFDRLMRGAEVSVGERLTWAPRRRWVHRSVEAATVLTVQTAALADAIAAATRVCRERIHVIPHGPGWVDRRAEAPSPSDRAGEAIRIGYVTKFGVQKNFATLFRAAGILAGQGRRLRLVLTLDPADPASAVTLAQARSMGIAHLLENRGEVDVRALADIYDSLDIFVFPSLCESFGMPMVEAMARGLCLVVADTPGNREVAGAAGVSFAALDADQLAAVLARLCDDRAQRHAAACKSLERARAFSWRQAARKTLAALNAAVAGP